ncbi:MAG TPA: energy transducer TonB, partial [Tepidisphaeraceae bacterium]|nr:energy transducer TonB [Tepidisphaeraceae bacterium]
TTPPKIHLVYGDHGGENSPPIISTPTAANPPALNLQSLDPPTPLTDPLEINLPSTPLNSPSTSINAPLLLTANGSDSPAFGVASSATPKFNFTAPTFPSSNGSESSESSTTSTRPGTQSGTDVASIPQPIYPKESRRRGEQGTVILEVEIKPDGSIGEITIVHDAGYPRLASAAIEALKKARIDPALENGQPIASTVRVPFNFVLR